MLHLETSDGQQVVRRRDTSLELVGPYTVIAKIAGGDYTTVHLAHKDGVLGFNRLAAIKRLKPAFAKQPEWTQLLLDEARFSAAVRHPHIVDILDVGTDAGVYIVMQYIEGADLDVLISRAGKERHPRYLVPPIVDALNGLHAAHTARDELGEPLCMVHQAPLARHILIGIDGLSRITDFSQASARGLIPSELREKRLAAGYMAPEQVLASDPLSARTDVFIAGITLWETLTGMRLFHADTPALARRAVTERHIPKASEVGLLPPSCFDDICVKALQRNPDYRYQSAQEMAQALRDAALNEGLYASASELGHWVRALASRALVERRRALGADAPSQEIKLDAIDVSDSAPTVELVRATPRSEPASTVAAHAPAVVAAAAEPSPLAVTVSSFASIKTPVLSTPAASVPASFADVQTSNAGAAGSVVAPADISNVDFSVPSEMVPMTNAPVAPLSSPSRADDSARAARTGAGASQPPITARPPEHSARPDGAAQRSSVGKATLIGVSQWPVGTGVPRHALATTMSYEATSAQRAAQRSGRSALPTRDIEELASHAAHSAASLNTTLAEPRAEDAPVLKAGRVSTTLPEGVLLEELPAPEPTEWPQPSAVMQPSKAVGVAEAFAADPAPHFPLASRSGFGNVYDSPASGAYRTDADGRRAPGASRQAREGVMPADIFARVGAAQAARRGASDSLRPPSAYSSDWDEVRGARRSGLTSMLVVGGLCIAGFFGYRSWSEQQDLARMRAAAAALPVDTAPAVAEPALQEPAELPAEPAAEPLQVALPEPSLPAPAPVAAAPKRAQPAPAMQPEDAVPGRGEADQAQPSAIDGEPVQKPVAAHRQAAAALHAPAQHRAAPRRAAAVEHQAAAQSWAAPRFSREPEVLPDNPY